MSNFYRIMVMALSAVILSAVTVRAGTEQCVRRYDSSLLTLSAVDAPDGNRYTSVSWEGLQSTSEVGAPELPVEYVRFIVPVYTNNFTAAVKVQKATPPKKMEHQVMPVQQPVPTSYTGTVGFTAPDSTLYSADYNIRAEVVEDGFIDGCNHIVTVAVYPMQYSATSGTYSLASLLTVELGYDDCGLTEMNHTPIFPPHMSKYLDLPSMVVNPDKVTNPRFAPKKKAEGLTKDYYYIITPRNLKEAFEDLAVWKRQKGYNVIVKCIEDIYEDDRYRIGNSHSLADSIPEQILDSAMSLRCYLKDQFQLNGQYFCLLAGDWRTPMPIRKVISQYSSYSSNDNEIKNSAYNNPNNVESLTPTDLYFCNLSKNYKLVVKTNTTIYSIVDSTINYSPDIFVGRLLCATPKEVQNYLHKLFLYEANPGYGDNDYLTKAFHVESCGRDWNEALGIWKHGSCLLKGSYDIVYKLNEIFNLYFIQDDAHVNLFGQSSADLDPLAHRPEDDLGPTAHEVIRRMSESGYVTYLSHGSPYGFLVGAKGHLVYSHDNRTNLFPYCDAIYTNLPESGLNNLTNKNKPFFVYSLSCKNAPFDAYEETWTGRDPFVFTEPNIGRAFTTENKFGAVGGVMNTRNGLYTHSAKIESFFIDALKIHHKAGVSFYLAKVDTDLGSGLFKYSANLIGDAEYDLWLDKPQTLSASLSPNTNGFEIEGFLPDSTMVSYFNGEYLAVKSYNIDSSMTNPFGSGDYCVSFWKTGYLPLITLFAQNGVLQSQKHYIVRDAVIGCKDGGETKYIVGKGGKLTVRAIDSAETFAGFEVEDGGVVELSCDQNIRLSGGIIRKGGKLIVCGKNVKFGKGFKVMPGGVLKINNKY